MVSKFVGRILLLTDEKILDANLEKFKIALKNDKDFAAYFDADLIGRVDELKCGGFTA